MDREGLQSPQGKLDWSGLTLFLVSISIVLLCLLLVRPFLSGVTWAVVLAIVTQRPHRWICARVKNPALAATTTTVLVALSIVVPIMLIMLSVGQHILQVVQGFQSGAAEQGVREFIAQHSRITGLLQYAMDNMDVSQAIEKSTSSLTMQLASGLGKSITAFTQVIVMLFILFFLYRDKTQSVSFLRTHIPLAADEADYLLLRLRAAINALVLGRFAVAGLQGLLSGIAYAALGVGAATLLGVATMLFALVPAVGAFVVWLPVVIYLALIHHWIQAMILLAAGTLVISLLDNVLYPILVGTQLRLHTVPIFLAMLGGVVYFGVSGLILGPIAFSAAESLMLIWRKRTTGEPLP
ncbi:MAG: AI-2E family transporter [Acidobacteriota bacterium]|nr:AI-2E family transporter [Acidobacteriota bacterium]